jgi:cytochrome c oxidase subunit 2
MIRTGLFWTCVLVLLSCAGPKQSSIDSAGFGAGEIERLWWFFFWLLLAIFVIVMLLLAGSLSRRTRRNQPELRPHPSPEREKHLERIVGSAVGATVLILLGLIVTSVVVGRSTSGPGTHSEMTIEVTGNQWWWYVRYLNDNASDIVVTANEIHIPVGKRVMIRGTSNDVIHSFWVPNLQGKRHLIPSRVTSEWLEAQRPGTFRGQCAEFCGLQHANMALWVVAEPESDFKQWYNAQLQPAPQPTDPVLQHGQQVFLNTGCVLCHNITGTPAFGQVAPDLTHIGSRRTIAAGTLPNTAGNMAGWISDPQQVKPGNHMATVPIKSEDLQPLVQYLESLK